ncbi:hypothetical protein [Microbacterium sp. NC79]|uniref:hypothetical protein n=1 Tax=Microbacterium sp. NC79 TaxID=2851009 RepID=UPI001C2BF73C|nr:hypothetical protein [Microbacterium sp. NC79]MBV0896198.1 hypothetical protein [Microbacterium sp. NC79]
MKNRILLIASIVAGGMLMYVFARGTISMPFIAVFVLIPIMALVGRWRAERLVDTPAYWEANRPGTGAGRQSSSSRENIDVVPDADDIDSPPVRTPMFRLISSLRFT